MKTKPERLTKAQKIEGLKTFYGGLMSSLLYSIKTRPDIPADIRRQAERLQEKWDVVSPHRAFNPITIIEEEKRLTL